MGASSKYFSGSAGEGCASAADRRAPDERSITRLLMSNPTGRGGGLALGAVGGLVVSLPGGRTRRRPWRSGSRRHHRRGRQGPLLAADLADADELAAFAEEVGTVDILVNNAGIGWSGPTNTLDLATYDEIFNTSVRSAYFLVAALARQDGEEEKRQHRQRRQRGRDSRPSW
jgi:NAD(P)-dependent dehydrogenase (short-subunit alcohol dehydrogenase family)